MVSKKNIDDMIQFAVLNRFNNIVVQVRGRGDAFYNSKFVPKSSLIKEQDLDPLAYLLPKAKEKGLKVHVWVNTYLLWSSGVKPIQSEHIINTKIEWLDHNQIQQRSIKETLYDNKNKKTVLKGLTYLLGTQMLINTCSRYSRSLLLIMILMVYILTILDYMTKDME